MMTAYKVCSHCGAKMVEYRHGLNQALAAGLSRIYRHNGPVNIKALGLTRNQWDNFQKLRYWDLVCKAQRDDGQHIGGAWIITQRGRDFVEGRITVASHVRTYRGERVRYEGEEVAFSKPVLRYKTRPEYAADAEPHQVAAA